MVVDGRDRDVDLRRPVGRTAPVRRCDALEARDELPPERIEVAVGIGVEPALERVHHEHPAREHEELSRLRRTQPRRELGTLAPRSPRGRRSSHSRLRASEPKRMADASVATTWAERRSHGSSAREPEVVHAVARARGASCPPTPGSRRHSRAPGRRPHGRRRCRRRAGTCRRADRGRCGRGCRRRRARSPRRSGARARRCRAPRTARRDRRRRPAAAPGRTGRRSATDEARRRRSRTGRQAIVERPLPARERLVRQGVRVAAASRAACPRRPRRRRARARTSPGSRGRGRPRCGGARAAARRRRPRRRPSSTPPTPRGAPRLRRSAGGSLDLRVVDLGAADDPAVAREAHVDGRLELDDPLPQLRGDLLGEHEVAQELELALPPSPAAPSRARSTAAKSSASASASDHASSARVRRLLVLVGRRDLRLPPGEVARDGERREPDLRLLEECAHRGRSYPRHARAITTVRDGERDRRDNAAMELVLGSCRAPARAGADLPPLLAVRRPGRRAARAGLVRRDASRPTSPSCSCATRSGELRAFLNVCRHRGSLLCEGIGHARDDPVPLPRLDVRARRQADGRAAPRQRGRRRARRARPRSAAARQLGTARLRQPRPGRAAARGVPRRRARAARRGRDRRLLASLPAARRSPSSRATGRSASRTSSSATTARSRTPASRR